MNSWEIVNRKLIAKGIAELSYEQILKPDLLDDGSYRLALAHGVSYRFEAWQTIWDYLRIDSASLVRSPTLGTLKADQFYLDTKENHGMSDITLANFLDELYRTQWSDLKTLEWQKSFADQDLLDLSDSVFQTMLDGHPKALVNKGRIGWSASDLEAFAPESGQTFRLQWLAVRKDLAVEEFAEGMDSSTRLLGTLGAGEAHRLRVEVEKAGLAFDSHTLIPVHPWQWNEVLAFHFQNEIHEDLIVPLGFFGDKYRPQTSLRTLSNEGDASRYQIKLPVSILNTSCVRGIDGKYIPISPKLTKTLRMICANDSKLDRVVILGDVSGCFIPHRIYQTMGEAPYRFKEFLGCVWRESPESLLEEGEKCMLTAALFHKTAEGRALLGFIITRSGLKTEEWLECYFKTILIPLYHLQLKYGVGLVSHGQNIMIALKDFIPSKLVLKDFQGDLRLLDEDIPELEVFDSHLKQVLTRLPAPYLIHDLLTGHFITVLRFISASLYEEQRFPETEFYRILGKTIRDYHQTIPAYEDRIDGLGVLSATIPRVLVNKVRFHIGYGDSALRPLPMVGSELRNPLHEAHHV